MTDWFGIFVATKPVGWTSRKVVDRVQRLVKPAKCGHAGTLDPLAEGVLVLCLGAATRLIEHVQAQPKSYTATFLLGRTSPSDDIELEPVELVDPPIPSRAELEAAAAKWTGEILQRPPAYSALKVQGQRAYDLARSGKDVELASRPVRVTRFEITRYEYPEVVAEIDCSSGTYVRSLGRDLAVEVGTQAVMSALVRTAIGVYRLADAVDPGLLTVDMLRSRLLPPQTALVGWPQHALSSEEQTALILGRTIEIASSDSIAGDDLVAISEGKLAALLKRVGGTTWRGDKVFCAPKAG